MTDDSDTTEYLVSDCVASSDMDWMATPIRETVRKAARLAVKVDIMMTEKNQKPATRRRAEKLRGGAPAPAGKKDKKGGYSGVESL